MLFYGMIRKTWRFISNHPLTKRNRLAALSRYLRYQFVTRTRQHSTIEWFGGAKISVAKNMSGASGNIYCGLHEPADMGFFLHFLRPNDLFLDIGANIGSFTIIASKICGATTIAFEPDRATAERLRRNVEVNDIGHLVEVAEVAVMDRDGEAQFSVGLDTTNHVLSNGVGQAVKCGRLDHYLKQREPTAMKLDVEGGEEAVFAGAEETVACLSLLAIEVESLTAAMLAQLQRNGFEQAYYDPWTRNLSRTRLSEGGNSLFVRDFEAVEERVKSARKHEILRGHFL